MSSLSPISLHSPVSHHTLNTPPHRECLEELVSMAMSVCDDINWECVRSEIGDVCREMVREAETVRQEKLEKLEKQVLAMRKRRYWKR